MRLFELDASKLIAQCSSPASLLAQDGWRAGVPRELHLGVLATVQRLTGTDACFGVGSRRDRAKAALLNTI